MADDRSDMNFAKDTQLDVRMARHRLKEGLVPGDTGIFLCIEEGASEEKTINLSSGGVYLIGRENADVPLDDEKVSRKHAEIGLYGPDAYVLRDLASTNGTFVNGRRVSEKVKLKHWDLIRVGDTLIRFVQIDDALPLSQ
jgi:pSer/pThr/pTyr-binding forkhead associated (FHA) protein